MFKSVLLATDGSPNAKRAAAIAADVAATYGARLTLVTIMSPAIMLEDVKAMPQARLMSRAAKEEMRRIYQIIPNSASDVDIRAYIPALPSLAQELGEAILNEAQSAASRRKVKTGKIVRLVLWGDAASQIVKQATKSNADLIIMGTRGLGNLRGLLIGSVSNKVIHNAKCPTLLVK